MSEYSDQECKEIEIEAMYAEIKRLRAEIERLQAHAKSMIDALNTDIDAKAAEIERLTALLKRHDDLCRWDEAMGVSSTWTPELLALVKDTRAALKDTTP